jgi:hypothetical protein
MGVNLWELWIIDKAGLTLVHVKNTELGNFKTISPYLFSGVLSAVETMADKNIESIKMKDSKILILPETDPVPIFFVGRANIKKKDKKIRKRLAQIRDSFLNEYREILPSWSGDQGIFDYFMDIVKEEFFFGAFL